ncbi:hypothetical protein [Methylobacterium segetis]|uniref:hypothetical protein n=1 Tax=Methylobacterium segetis TaxID=2488750 RepID=UPI00140433C3|nr:hypothetical protein [Methylobacterium segetis]
MRDFATAAKRFTEAATAAADAALKGVERLLGGVIPSPAPQPVPVRVRRHPAHRR